MTDPEPTAWDRLVLDTNVLVSGLLNPDGIPGDVLNLVLQGQVVICADSRVLREYGEVLRRPKFKLAVPHVNDLLAFLEEACEPVTPMPLPSSMALPDPTDRPFLEVALAARVPLVTGNRRHFPAHSRCGVEVLGPTEWLAHRPCNDY